MKATLRDARVDAAVERSKKRARGPLMPRVKAPGQKRRAINRWYRENVVGKVTMVSKHAAAKRGTRTPERRKS